MFIRRSLFWDLRKPIQCPWTRLISKQTQIFAVTPSQWLAMPMMLKLEWKTALLVVFFINFCHRGNWACSTWQLHICFDNRTKYSYFFYKKRWKLMPVTCTESAGIPGRHLEMKKKETRVYFPKKQQRYLDYLVTCFYFLNIHLFTLASRRFCIRDAVVASSVLKE